MPIEEFAAFLIQFLGGDEEQTQRRWWLSLREWHARFRISPDQRQAWLRHMKATIGAAPLDGTTRSSLRQFFEQSSLYIMGQDSAVPEHDELALRWRACWMTRSPRLRPGATRTQLIPLLVFDPGRPCSWVCWRE